MKHGFSVRFVCGEPFVENQCGGGGLGKPFLCMRGRNCIIDIIRIICISCSGGDASKSPGYGDFFWLLLV